MKKINEKKWKPFVMMDLFESFVRGKVSSAADEPKCITGVPYVGATDRNNGVLDFFKKNDKKLQLGNCITFIKDGQGSVGSSVYRATTCIATVNTSFAYAEWLNEFNGLFVSTASNQVRAKYGFGYKRKEKRLLAERIMLPVGSNGEPDYDYMEEYTRKKREFMLAKYRTYIQARISELGEIVEVPALNEKMWKPFVMRELFESLVRGKVSSAADEPKCITGVPYVGATDRNNGVLDFFKKNDRKLQLGNCITFIRDGQGSVGSSVYRATPCIATVNTTSAYAKWLNEFNGLFVSTASNQVRAKYGFGYKRKEKRLLAERIMLPVNDTGEPDYAYMEQYAKNMMLKKYKQYLAFLAMKESHAQKHSRIKTCNVS